MAKAIMDKESFFKELEALDYLTDSSQEYPEGDFGRLISHFKDLDRPCPTDASNPKTPDSVQVQRAETAPQSSQAAITAAQVSVESVVASEDSQKPAVKRARTMGVLRKKKTSPSAGKRRQSYTSKTVPAQQKIFTGLVFFFFPNNDISPIRRLRIQRAVEYGAERAKSWQENVTHVIVDKGLTFQEVVTFLEVESLPATVALVNETYPSECINFRSLLSVEYTRFRVNGAPRPSAVEELPSAGQSSAGSLQLKPPRREAHSPTPSYAADSESERDELPRPDQAEEKDAFSKNTAEEGEGEVVGSILSSRERDALDDMIDEAKAGTHLPLDPLESLEDDASRVTDENLSASGSESNNSKRRKISPEEKVTDAWQQKFACMQKHDTSSNSESPNSRTIEVLQQMLDYYTRTSDHWRVIAYRKAISALRRQPGKIVTKSQALSITGIGPRLADKIEEIVFTNRLRRLENASFSPEDLIFQEFLGVYGAGISQASRWVAQGYKSLEDLRTKASLTRNQRVGVEHYHDFAQRIPRQEVEAHGNIVQEAVQKVDSGMQVIISGSYRRGAVSSGDIDVLITKPNTTIEQIRTVMMDVVIPRLFKQGFLQVSLASTSRGDGSKWHGASALPGSNLWRRIDLLFVPDSEIGAALIYFTGNDIFNRSIRLLASKKGMRLNQRGLFADVLRGEQRAKLNTGRLLEGHDERQIFQLLGVPWRPPEHRIC